MALLWCDQPVNYTTATIAQRWTTVTAGMSIGTATIPRTGTACVVSDQSSHFATKTFGSDGGIAPSGPTAIIGFRYRLSFLTSGIASPLQITDAGTAQVTVVVKTDGTIEVRRGTVAGTVLGTTGFALSINTFYYLELRVTIDDTVGTIDLYIDNVNRLSLTGIDTKNTANASWNGINLGNGGGATGFSQFWTDLYVEDGTDGTIIGQRDAFASVLGDIKVEYLAAQSGNGSNTGWTPSTGTDHGALVDDGASGPNGDTDYNSSATAGTKDTYNLVNLPSSAVSVIAVCPIFSCSKDDSGSKYVAPVYRVGGVDYLSATSQQAPSVGSYSMLTEIQTKSPATGITWATSEVNALEAGLQVTA